MRATNDEADELKRIENQLKQYPPEKLGVMFANCYTAFRNPASSFHADARSRLRLILREWKNRSYYLPTGTDRDRPDPGLLKCIGYSVGRNGPSEIVRRNLVDYLMTYDHLPPVKDNSYMLEWGKSRTAKRFYKLERVLKAFKIQHEEDKIPPEKAIREWNRDLTYVDQRWGFVGRRPSK